MSVSGRTTDIAACTAVHNASCVTKEAFMWFVLPERIVARNLYNTPVYSNGTTSVVAKDVSNSSHAPFTSLAYLSSRGGFDNAYNF